MANYNFPNVYPNIKDLSQVVTANAITSCAYVGESEFGPINTPILVTNLKNYTDKFGALNPKYGYMGYSLAVASDTINSHYVVRVVDEDTAKYSAKFVALKGETAKVYEDGYYVGEVNAAKEDSSSFFIDPVTGTTDSSDAFVILASNPNNKTVKVSIADSTINTNKNILSLSNTKTTTDITVVLPQSDLFERNDKVLVNNEDDNLKKTGVVNTITPTYNFSATVSEAGTGYHVGDAFTIDALTTESGSVFTGKVVSVTSDNKVRAISLDITNDTKIQEAGVYETTNTTDPTATGLKILLAVEEFKNIVTVTFDEPISEGEVSREWEDIRLLKLPEDSETTFSISVYEVNGRVTTRVEYFQYLNKLPLQIY